MLHRYASRLILASTGLLACLATTPGCGGGGLLGNQNPASNLAIEVLEEAAYLSRPGLDVRTVYLVKFQLSAEDGGPVEGLSEQNFTFIRDGNPATSENAGTPSGDLARVDIALCLDNSNSIAFGSNGIATPENVETLRQSAIAFVDSVAESADTLRLYRFSTSSRTELIGRYNSDGSVWGIDPTTGQAPQVDIVEAIAPDPVLDNGTALYQCLNLAFSDDPEGNSLTVVLSDGIEEGSAPGSQEAALNYIQGQTPVIYSVGVGAVNPAELQSISEYGEAFLIDTFDAVDAVFAAVGNRVRSIYTIVYDTPLQEGDHTIELRVTTADGESIVHQSSFAAGIDLANGNYYRPLTPGSSVTYLDPNSTPNQVTFNVLGVANAATSPDTGVLHFATESSSAPGTISNRAAPFGVGAIRDLPGQDEVVYAPAELREGTSWPYPSASSNLPVTATVVAFEDLDVQGFTYEQCARVELTFPASGASTGTLWLKKGIGLVRSQSANEVVLRELKMPPSPGTLFF